MSSAPTKIELFTASTKYLVFSFKSFVSSRLTILLYGTLLIVLYVPFLVITVSIFLMIQYDGSNTKANIRLICYFAVI